MSLFSFLWYIFFLATVLPVIAVPTRPGSSVSLVNQSEIFPTYNSTASIVTVHWPTSSLESGPRTISPPTLVQNFQHGKPKNWPTRTQSGPTYSTTRATSSDPYLKSVSYALNNKHNGLYTQKHTGDLTYYAQGITACGDWYDDSSYTAAVSHAFFDAWPGATSETNRSYTRAKTIEELLKYILGNPICGPYVSGRFVLDKSGRSVLKVSSATGNIFIGGDGLPNCAAGVGQRGQCHIPLTATITNPSNGKSVVVKIVDRCQGCKGFGDIDVTPTVFKALAPTKLGRIHRITWKFNQY